MLSKISLDDAGMGRCADCSKLYEVRGESPYCRECMRERGEEVLAQTFDPEAALQEKTERLMALFSPAKLAKRAVTQADGLRALAPVNPCTRCKKRECVDESDFCLACHLELDNVLGAASRDLLSRVELIEAPRKRSRGPSVMDAYGELATERNKNAVVPPHSRSPRSM